jgi:hypothetical protein
LIDFKIKNTLKNNLYHNIKHYLLSSVLPQKIKQLADFMQLKTKTRATTLHPFREFNTRLRHETSLHKACLGESITSRNIDYSKNVKWGNPGSNIRPTAIPNPSEEYYLVR